jgi:hypothetical protein
VAALGWPTGPQVGSDSTFSQDFGATTLTTSSAGSFAVGGVIGRSYRTSGGVTSFLGAATGPERVVGDGVVQDFQGGRIYCSAAATTAVPAAVGKALEAAGGVKGRLGWPTGPVLKGTAGPYAEIELQLFPESSKEVEMFLLERNIQFDTQETRRFSGDRVHPVSVFTLLWEDAPLKLSVFDPRDERVALKTSQAGRVMDRAGIAEVGALLGMDPNTA